MKSLPEKSWSLIIKPKKRLLDLHLNDLWRSRDLIGLFVRRDFVAQFKQTILGPAWFVIQPLLTTLMFTIVFGNIAQLSTDGLPKILFYLSGNILWSYFSLCLTSTSDTFTANAHLFGKVYFPRLAVPISVIISNFMKFGLQFILFFGILSYYLLTGTAVELTWAVALIPLLLVLMAGLSLGMGIIISSMTTKYRDLKFMLSFGVQLSMYATPVIYPMSSIPERWRAFIWFNPMTPIIETFRFGFLGTGSFSWLHLGYSAVVTFIVLFIGTVIFNRVEQTFMDTV